MITAEALGGVAEGCHAVHVFDDQHSDPIVQLVRRREHNCAEQDPNDNGRDGCDAKVSVRPNTNAENGP